MGPWPGFVWSAGARCKSLSGLASNDLTLLLLFSLDQGRGICADLQSADGDAFCLALSRRVVRGRDMLSAGTEERYRRDAAG
jgi:hypothetical protein